MPLGAIHIGTSGWHYQHWRGPFYPAKMPPSKMLAFYSQHFNTVELNNTFYRLPTPKGVENWRTTTPSDFCFSAKGSRFLTHMKKLKDPETGVARYFERIGPLGKKLGVIVFQLPPFWDVDTDRLEAFLRVLPAGYRYAFELRNPTWHVAPVFAILEKYNAAFCIFEIAGFKSSCQITADFTYVRLHGPADTPYQGSYSDATLDQWASQVFQWKRRLRAVYVYFDNDQGGYAVNNALSLKRLVGG